jgi:glycosyltransferase involved in cell wall biosynthesis
MRPIENIVQYDAAANEDPRQQGFGFNKLAEYIDTCSPDIVMLYNDPIVVNQFLDSIKNVPKTFQIWVYLDLVYEGTDQGLLRNIEKGADRIFCFTQKWLDYLKSRIPTTEKTLSVMEHGVDMSVFNRQTDSERIATRKQMNIPSDAIVFLNMNRNSERKRLDLSVMAFARLLKRNPELPIYMLFVTSMNPQSGAHYNPIQIYMNELNLLKLDVLKLGQRIVSLDTSPPKLFDDKTVNSFYNACDYGINTANGEGFGLCQLEHLATGAPQVVIDVGDYNSFMNKNVAEIVPATSYSYMSMTTGIGLTQKSASAEEVADAMERIL